MRVAILGCQQRRIHTAVRNRARNWSRHARCRNLRPLGVLRHARGGDLGPLQVPKIGTWKSYFFLTFANSKVKTLRVATLAAAAAHPHSYAQPRAQLLGACAWLGLGALWGFPRSEHENNSV